jgi:Na+-translocating ferredoxin:NAD+ oxidoreductase RnfD subunit
MSEELAINQSRAILGRPLIYLNGALLIILLAAAAIFGPYVLLVATVSIGISAAFDYLFIYFKKASWDGSVLLYPIIFTLMLPPSAPLWIAGVGAAFGNLFGKRLFGGYGKTIFHPSVVGILFLTVSFPIIIFGWFDPTVHGWYNPFIEGATGILEPLTPLHNLNATGDTPATLVQLLLGQTAGNIGENFTLLILVLGSGLMALKVIDWKLPVSILGSFFLLSVVFQLLGVSGDSLKSLLSGSLIFGAFFVASDPVHAPVQSKAVWAFGFGVALITFVIRNFATFAEGFIFALIIMTAVGYLIDGFLTKKEASNEANS